MKRVFVHATGQQWTVVDKSTGKVIDTVDDVLIFNGEYKRYNGLRGWHGILSEEINKAVIDLLQDPFIELTQRTVPYYPRMNWYSKPIKTAVYVKLTKGKAYVRYENGHPLPSYELAQYTKPFDNQDFIDEDEEDYTDEDEEEEWSAL